MPLVGPPPGKKQMPTSAEAMSPLEGRLLGDLDLEKLSDLAEVLFALNNYRIGPIPGFYVAVEVTPGQEWCVGQLSADRAKPLKLFDKRIYKKPETARAAAERMREKDLAEMQSPTLAKKPAARKKSMAKKKTAAKARPTTKSGQSPTSDKTKRSKKKKA